MAGEPTTLLGEHRHLAVVQHDRHPVLVNRRLLALLDSLIEARTAVDLPVLAVIAVIGVFDTGTLGAGLPLEAQIGVLCVIGGLHGQIHITVLALDRHWFDLSTLDKVRPHVLLFVRLVMARGAGIAALGLFRGIFMLTAQQPLVGRLSRIEERNLDRRYPGPVDGDRIDSQAGAGRSHRCQGKDKCFLFHEISFIAPPGAPLTLCPGLRDMLLNYLSDRIHSIIFFSSASESFGALCSSSVPSSSFTFGLVVRFFRIFSSPSALLSAYLAASFL